MYVRPMFVVHILTLCRFDEFPCHLTQALCHGATTNHLVRMVERGRLRDTKFSRPTPSDVTAQEWIEHAMRTRRSHPTPSTHVSILPPNPLLRRSHTGDFEIQRPPLCYLPRRADSDPPYPPRAIQVRFWCSQSTQRPFFEKGRDSAICLRGQHPRARRLHKIEGYGHSGLEALVSCCFHACQLLQTNGLLEPAHFPTVYPFVPVPRTIEPQQSKKAKSNGVRTHPRRTPTFLVPINRDPGGFMVPYHRIYRRLDGGVWPACHSDPTSIANNSDFSLFISGNPVNVRLRKCQPGLFSPDELEQLRRTTLRIMRFVGNKPFVCDLNQFPYLLFPLEPDIALLIRSS
jgi:hypothetical protein